MLFWSCDEWVDMRPMLLLLPLLLRLLVMMKLMKMKVVQKEEARMAVR